MPPKKIDLAAKIKQLEATQNAQAGQAGSATARDAYRPPLNLTEVPPTSGAQTSRAPEPADINPTINPTAASPVGATRMEMGAGVEDSASLASPRPDVLSYQDKRSAYMMNVEQNPLDKRAGAYMAGGLYVEKYDSQLSQREAAMDDQYAVFKPSSLSGSAGYTKKSSKPFLTEYMGTNIIPNFWTPDRPNPPEFYRGKATISRIDFLPSAVDDTLEVLAECMNDWIVRSRAEVLNIETLEVEWPETTVFHRRRSAWFGSTTFFVRMLRVWYRTYDIPPVSEQRFAKGPTYEPSVFDPMPLPDVNKHATTDHTAMATGGSMVSKDGEVLQKAQLRVFKKLPTSSAVRLDIVYTSFIMIALIAIILRLWIFSDL